MLMIGHNGAEKRVVTLLLVFV